MTPDETVSIYEATVERFSDDLATEGFTVSTTAGTSGRRWSGHIQVGAAKFRCDIEIGPNFPFVPAQVFLPEHTGTASWHRERDGALCLWTDQDRAGLPWLDAKKLREKIEAWAEADAAGWPDQPPALDLDAYLEPDKEPRFVLVEEWDQIRGRWLTFATDDLMNTKITIARADSSTAGFRKNKGAIGVALEIGNQAAPIREWSDLESQVDEPMKSDIAGWTRARGEVILVVRYLVDNKPGLFAASLRFSAGGELKLTGLSAADAGEAELALRGGLNRDEYAKKKVALIGAGAVGSFLADQLARAGVGKLLLYDPDPLYPGNLIRHLCQTPLLGLPKASAVKVSIDARRYPGPVEVAAKDKRLVDLKVAIGILESYDLVIDATADGAVGHLLLEATKRSPGAREYLAVAVEGGGEFARVEVVPTPAGETPLPTTGVSAFPMLISGGCGSPISPTPPSAVLNTAAIAARCALSLLRGEKIGAGYRESLKPIP